MTVSFETSLEVAQLAGERSLALMRDLRQLQVEHGLRTVTATMPIPSLVGLPGGEFTLRWSGDTLEVKSNDGWLRIDGSEFL